MPVSRSFEHHTGNSTIWLVSTPILREDTWGGQGLPTYLPLPSTSREDLRLDGYFIVPSCRGGTTHLQTFMPSPGFEPRPYSTTVSVANPYYLGSIVGES
ncbi:hypothetical protein TNCV_278581 [Trichonephila clavipes]|nr:hypothetical protein TNCV_278581 [Trichonephila clavipes]